MRSKDLSESSMTTSHRLLNLMRISIQIHREVLNGPRKILSQRSLSLNTIEIPTGMQTRKRVTNPEMIMISQGLRALSIPSVEMMKTKFWEP